MVLFLKNPDLYSESVYISQVEGQGLSVETGFERGCEVSGVFFTTLFELFQNTSIKNSSNSDGDSSDNASTATKNNSTSTKHQNQQQGAVELLLLIDNYSTERSIQILDILHKLLTIAIKDCNQLLKSAEYTRKLATFVETVRQNNSHSNKFLVRNRKYKQQSTTDRSSRGNRGSSYHPHGDSNSSSSELECSSMQSDQEEEEAVLKQLELPYQRLCRLYATTISTSGTTSSGTQYTMLFSFLATVPVHVYVQFKKWLVQKIHSCPLNPKGERLVQVRRVKAVLGEWERLQAGLGRLLEVVNRRPRQVIYSLMLHTIYIVESCRFGRNVI